MSPYLDTYKVKVKVNVRLSYTFSKKSKLFYKFVAMCENIWNLALFTLGTFEPCAVYFFWCCFLLIHKKSSFSSHLDNIYLLIMSENFLLYKTIKGQLISKCLSGIFNFSKKELENLNFCPSPLGRRKFSFGVWKNWKLKKSFQN